MNSFLDFIMKSPAVHFFSLQNILASVKLKVTFKELQ